MISIDDILDELPEGKLLLTIIDADGVVRASGIGIWPAELSGCCRTPWYRECYGKLPAIDLNWLPGCGDYGRTSVWPVTEVLHQSGNVVLVGPRGRALLRRLPRRLWIGPDF